MIESRYETAALGPVAVSDDHQLSGVAFAALEDFVGCQMTTDLKPYDQVRVAAIRDNRFAGQPVFYDRHPCVGDVAVIVETHRPGYAYEVECSNPENGQTIWLDAMFADELEACPT